MAAENKPASNNNSSKGKKRKFLPHGKVVRKGLYPLRPGVQGFFITCDGGRERQAANEALNLLESFYEELVHGSDSGSKSKTIPNKPLNKIIKFEDSDSSSDEDESLAKDEVQDHEEESKRPIENKNGKLEDDSPQREDNQDEKQAQKNDSIPAKRQRLENDPPTCENVDLVVTKNKPIDELIEDELRELGDRSKRHFVSLDSGCNGCIFVQMHRRPGDPGPVAIAHKMISSAAVTKKHMSRFILRVLPAEVTCYASEEEISKSIKPLIEQYFPLDTSSPLKFAVLYEARSNTGIERMSIINAVAKSVPSPHTVDLNKPDKTIIVQIAKTICMIGVVEKYKELAKYNLRQLTSPQN
ncbi:THUMP domain-containing protein 1 homolog [Phalaenopsis equestris]|uniref:THUMP domain-containing protein 1 homolog n=1 Tax=Phalaenopsis equestris TaxID=78828 RepID=UPI0009E57C55|nr:THUMP domain-containing protein 1 homolog [Phalaenopsis equestris]